MTFGQSLARMLKNIYGRLLKSNLRRFDEVDVRLGLGGGDESIWYCVSIFPIIGKASVRPVPHLHIRPLLTVDTVDSDVDMNAADHANDDDDDDNIRGVRCGGCEGTARMRTRAQIATADDDVVGVAGAETMHNKRERHGTTLRDLARMRTWKMFFTWRHLAASDTPGGTGTAGDHGRQKPPAWPEFQDDPFFPQTPETVVRMVLKFRTILLNMG
ncbi:hypothetical protein B0H11DRAFT_1923025 [Mycena galericulata]|nr:hypothetical protein B0H11DRAFT_1923025 [Mycena galericulata]